MFDRTAVAYRYDGTFEGLLTCVFESYARKEIPYDIHKEEEAADSLFEPIRIATDTAKAERVRRSIPEKISEEALELMELGFLSCVPRKELLILQFLRLGYRHGAAVTGMLADDTVNALHTAARQVSREAHKLKGFVRFSVYGSVMAAVIEPVHEVLPLLMEHFCDRYRNEAFLIHDKTHGKVLAHRHGQSGIFPLEELELPPADAGEEDYRRMWRRFYDAVAIEGRTNLRLRMSHMPKRYWSRLTEMQEEKEPSAEQASWKAGRPDPGPRLFE